jgi:uridine kinase
MNDSNELKNTGIKPFVIGISGGSASGKTSVSQIIFKMIGIQDCNMISMDSYYKVIRY